MIARSGVSAGFVSYWNEDIFVTDGFGLEPKEQLVTCKFLYYLLKNRENKFNEMKRGAGVPHISSEALLNTVYYLPSIGKQQELVTMLNRFENLCSDLSQGLPAEIEARKKQYEYYRDKLLSFKKK